MYVKAKRMIVYVIVFSLLVVSVAGVTFASNEKLSDCYVYSYICPDSYYCYAENNITDYMVSINDGELPNYGSIYLGTPFTFMNTDSDVFYFPVICDGKILYLFRIYEYEDNIYGAISSFLADDIEKLSSQTSPETPMTLKMEGNIIVASIGSKQYELFEYPEYMSCSVPKEEHMSYKTEQLTVVNAKKSAYDSIRMVQSRDVPRYINLSITETQPNGNYWCSAYCVAAIIRTKTSYNSVTAYTMAEHVFGANPSARVTFPWASIDDVANIYGLHPTVSSTTISDYLLMNEINMGRPVIVAMDRGTDTHAIVLRGYTSIGIWSVWNPWNSFYESYASNGPYVPTGYPASTHSYTPYRHAYNFS